MALLLPAHAQVFNSEVQRFRVQTVTEGLEFPWGLAFLPDGRMLVSERPGRLRLVAADGRLDPKPIEGLPPSAAIGQGGLLDVALHPNFARNTLVYLSYAAEGPGGYGTEVLRGRLDGHALRDVQ
ncbi:MAG: PQQ-dependent sugar dehydrogenase, partial [Dechloromonas sp.]|nr:PQQ-dependent sugar dehydrogenase [Dechloromonas sp.]